MNAPSKFLEIDSGLPFFVCHETKMAVRNRISDRVRFGNPSGKNGKEAKKLFSAPLLGILILDSRGQIIKKVQIIPCCFLIRGVCEFLKSYRSISS